MVCAPPLTWTDAQFDEAGAAIQKALDQTFADVKGEVTA
jgi:putrescine aminotransferase